MGGGRRDRGGRNEEERGESECVQNEYARLEVPTMRCDNEGREGGGGVRLGHREDTFIRNVTCTQRQ